MICPKHQGVNLAQEFPNLPAPPGVNEATLKALRADLNQYAITWGTPNLRQAIFEEIAWYKWIPTSSSRNVFLLDTHLSLVLS